MSHHQFPQILVADNREEVRLSLRHLLSQEGYDVVEALDGEEALELFHKIHPALILLAAAMAKMDGFAVCRQIRRLAAGAQVPIIMITALGDTNSADLAFEAGASEYITKPVHGHFLLQRIKHLLAPSQAEANLASSSAKLQAIFTAVIDGIVTINESGLIEEFNPAAEKIFGYQTQEVVGQNFGMLLPEPFRAELGNYLHNYLKTGQTKIIGTIKEIEGLNKNGNTFPLEFSLSEVCIQGKRIFTAIARDITDRKTTTALLQENEDFIRNILNSLNFGVAVLDSSGVIVATNDEWRRFAQENNGEPAATGLGVNYLEVARQATEPDQLDGAQAVAGLETIISEASNSFELEYPCHSPQEKRWFLMQAAPLKSKQGCVIVSHLNITARKVAEDKVRKNEASLQEAQRIAHLGNWDWDITSNELRWSNEIYRIFGLEPQQFRGTYEGFLAAVHPDDRDMVTDAVNLAITKGRRYDLIHRIVRPDHSERIVHEQGEVFYGQSGKPSRMVGTVHDVTREKRAEKALQEYSENLERLVQERTAEYIDQKIKAEQANQTKTEFLANISHELNTPLNAIIGFAEILQKEMLGALNEGQSEMVSDIVESGRDLHQMVSMILKVANMEKQNIELDRTIFYPAKMLANVVEHFSTKVAAKNQHLEVNIAEEIETTRGDELKIREAVSALVSNAVKFTPAGGKIYIMAKKKNGQLEICVSDSGPGIAKEDQGHIFKPFTQLDSSFTKEYGGTGMGLYLAKTLVELHGGTLWLESTRGAGSTFCFSLPDTEDGEN